VGIITTDEQTGSVLSGFPTSSHKAKESKGFTKLCNTDEHGSSGLSMEAGKTHSLRGFTNAESCAHNQVDEEYPLTDLSLTDPPQAPQPEEKGIIIGNDLNV